MNRITVVIGSTDIHLLLYRLYLKNYLSQVARNIFFDTDTLPLTYLLIFPCLYFIIDQQKIFNVISILLCKYIVMIRIIDTPSFVR